MSLSAKHLLLAGGAVGITALATWTWSTAGSPDAPVSPVTVATTPTDAPSSTAPVPSPTRTPAERQPVAKGRPKLQGAHIRDEDTLFDWGTLPAGETFKHTFVLHNDGDAALHIQKTRPS